MDLVSIRCAECGGLISLQREDLGHRVRCPLCQKVILAAPPPDSPPAAPPAPAGEHAAPSPGLPELQAVERPDAAFELSATPAEPREGESIFSPPEDSGDDVFGGHARRGHELPPVDALLPPGAHAVAPDLPPLEPIPGPAQSAANWLAAAEAAPASGGSGPALLRDHAETGIAAAAPDFRPRAEGLPAAASAPARAKTSSGVLGPILLITLVPYSIFATAIIGYLLWQQRNNNKDPTIRYLEKMLEQNPNKGGKEVQRVQHDYPLPPNLRTRLHDTLGVGAIEVRPLKVALSPTGEQLVLYLRLKNISSKDNGGRLAFNPLPAKFAEYNHKKPDPAKPYIFLEAGDRKLYGAKVQWLEGPVGAEKAVAGGFQLQPGQEMTVHLATLPEDQDQIPAVMAVKGPLLWRVQLRRGLETLQGDDYIVTCVVGVEFNSSDVLR